MKGIGPDHKVRCAEKKCLGHSCPYNNRCDEPMRIETPMRTPKITLEETTTMIPLSKE